MTNENKKWFGTNAERLAAPIGKFQSMDKYYEYDTGNEYITDGVAWFGTEISGTQISTDQLASFANSAGANTQINVDFAKPDAVKQTYALSIYNPSTVTDLTVKIFAKALAIQSSTQYLLLETIFVPKSQSNTGTTIPGIVRYLDGLFVGCDIRFVISNNTALGVAEGFGASVRLREVR